MNVLVRLLPGSSVFRVVDVLYVMGSGIVIHFVATAAFWFPVVVAGCAHL